MYIKDPFRGFVQPWAHIFPNCYETPETMSCGFMGFWGLTLDRSKTWVFSLAIAKQAAQGQWESCPKGMTGLGAENATSSLGMDFWSNDSVYISSPKQNLSIEIPRLGVWAINPTNMPHLRQFAAFQKELTQDE